MLSNMISLVNGEHIFYYTKDEQRYIQNLIEYIVTGIRQGDHVILVDNDRIFNYIKKELEDKLTVKEFLKFHFTNNFDFYCLENDFYVPTILTYFNKVLEPYLESNSSVRTWAHVEWGDHEEIEKKISSYEDISDSKVNDLGLTSVCAYNANRLSLSLKTNLMTNHEFFMTDADLIRSDLYREK